MIHELKNYLDDIENRLDPEQEEKILTDWKLFAQRGWKEACFFPRRNPCEPGREWPYIPVNDAIESDELMIISQFSLISEQLQNGYGGLLSVRGNYGVGVMPSLFGAPPFVMPREVNTLPNVRSLPGGIDAIKEIAAGGIPELTGGYSQAIFRVGAMYQEIFQQYPRIAKYIRVDHPDCQGPMDICELLWGSDMFLALYENKELLKNLLKTITDTYKAFMVKWFALTPDKDELHSFFGNAYLGRVCIRDDSAMNISPEMYEEFIFPYNDEILTFFNGGAIHSCGRVDHFVPLLSRMKHLHGFNMSQPEYNSMERVFSYTIDKGIPLIGLRESTVLEAQAAGRDLKGIVSMDLEPWRSGDVLY